MHGRPYVLVNMAMTADGKIDTVARRGARISGAADTARVDRLRAEADAVMVGGHTLLSEDPRLTVRDATLARGRVRDGRSPQPTKVGVASRIGAPGSSDGLPSDSRFLHDGDGRVIVSTTSRTERSTIEWLEGQGAQVRVHDGERVDLVATLAALADDSVARLMVEGGSTLVAALLEARLVDEIRLAVAPRLFGGESAPTPVGGPGWAEEEAIPMVLAGATPNEDGDVVLRYLIASRPSA